MNVQRYVKIGLFFLSLGVSGTAYVILAGDGFSSWNTKEYEVLLDDATGLSINSKVFMAGVPVGKIQEISLDEGRAVLRVAFLKDVEIRGDAQISRQASSLLGTSILALNPGTPETPILREGGRVESASAGGDFRTTLTAANELSAQIGAILADFQVRHMELLAASLETINSLGTQLDKRSAAELDRVSRILESAALIAERFEQVTREREGDIDASVLEVRAALENIREITEAVQRGDGNLGRAFADDELYERILSTAKKAEEAADSLNEALDNVNGLATATTAVVHDAGEIVAKANGLGVQVDVRSGYDFLNARVRSGASLFLEPRSGDRWYRVGVNGAPEGVSESTTTVTTDSGGTSTEERTVTRGGFTFDAELARRFGPLTVRGGLFENTAGFGLDFRPISPLELSGELFDFSSNALPNLRGYLTVYPFFDPKSDNPLRWLYLRGGVVSALDAANRDFFLGGGVRFADDEVRGLVGLVPLAGK